MRKVENESNNFSYFIKGKYVIEFSPNSRGFSGRPDQFLSIRWIHCKNTSWNSRGCVKRAVGKSGEVSSSDISVNCSISANMNSKGTTQIPCFTVGQEKRNFGSKRSTESTQCCICILNPCFVILRVNFWY